MTTTNSTETNTQTLPLQHSLDEALLMSFSTPLLNLVWPDSEEINDALRGLILGEAGESAGISRSNVGGWHSDVRFLAREADCVGELRTRIEQVINELTRRVARPQSTGQRVRFDVEAWANVSRHGHYHSPHNHPNALWSGVYYVTGNEEVAGHPFSGKLELIDPRPGASLTYAELTDLYGRFLLSPRAGQMIVFPGWLQHFVHPYFGTGERISIAFNVSVVAYSGNEA